MISVVVADDQELVREGLRMMLDAEPDISVVGEAADGNEALLGVDRHNPDVLLMDVRMPTLDGIEATRRLTASGARARVLVLTTFDLDEYVYLAMKAGASGFLLKDATREQLASAVRTVAGGQSLLAPAITRRLIEDFCSRPQPSAGLPDAVSGLSERELGVLQLLARGLSNAEIAKTLYLGETTVKSHVARILAKLSLRDRIQAVVFAYETGLITPGQQSEPGSAQPGLVPPVVRDLRRS
jgi:DNA-binding NarL/FixJ family response regulator